MNKIQLFTASVLFSIMCLTSCKTQVVCEENHIPFVEAKNYFVKNNAPCVPMGKITSQHEFDTLFGCATTMSSRPTEIDFNKQFVIAVSQQETDRATSYVPLSLVSKEGKMVFSYRAKQGEKLAYRMQPLMLIIVDKKYETDVFCEMEKK